MCSAQSAVCRNARVVLWNILTRRTFFMTKATAFFNWPQYTLMSYCSHPPRSVQNPDLKTSNIQYMCSMWHSTHAQGSRTLQAPQTPPHSCHFAMWRRRLFPLYHQAHDPQVARHTPLGSADLVHASSCAECCYLGDLAARNGDAYPADNKQWKREAVELTIRTLQKMSLSQNWERNTAWVSDAANFKKDCITDVATTQCLLKWKHNIFSQGNFKFRSTSRHFRELVDSFAWPRKTARTHSIRLWKLFFFLVLSFIIPQIEGMSSYLHVDTSVQCKTLLQMKCDSLLEHPTNRAAKYSIFTEWICEFCEKWHLLGVA